MVVKSWRMKRLWVLAAILVLALAFGQSAEAAAFIVANGDIAGLRAAINTANGNNQDDVIVLATGGAYRIATVDNTSSVGPNGLPVIQPDNGHTLGFIGSNTVLERSSVPGTPEFRILQIANGKVVLSGLTMGNGITRLSGGGAIYMNQGTLSLQSCSLTANSAIGSTPAANPGAFMEGGAIMNANGFGTVTATDCTFSSNTVTGGMGSPKFDGGYAAGGAISHANSLTRCTFSNNSVTGGTGGDGAPNFNGGKGGDATGGAVYGVTTLNNCTFGHNTAQGGTGGSVVNGVNPGAGGPAAGGAVQLYAGAGIVDCYFATNSASGGSSPSGTVNSAKGGAMVVYATLNGSPPLSITNTTFELNSVTTPISVGGAIAIPNGGATPFLQNCTFVQNSSTYEGGAFYAQGASGFTVDATIYHCTFSGNSAAFTGGVYCASGGTIGGGIANTIFRKGSTGGNINASFPSKGHNICDDNGGFVLGVAGDMVNTNPQLATTSTANNGGKTRTIALLSTSPAINYADEAYAPHRDQRGDFRTGPKRRRRL